MANISRIGFGQVEPNHLSAQRTAQIYAQLPATKYFDVLENGQFVKYDYADGYVSNPAQKTAHSTELPNADKGEWMLIFNEVKLYDEWRESYKDFAMIKDNYTPDYYYASKADQASDTRSYVSHEDLNLKGQMVPRVFKTNIGDIMTTNCLKVANTTGKATVTLGADTDLVVGNVLVPNTSGYLEYKASPAAGDMQWEIVAVTTMPDGQAGLKIMRIA